MKSTTASFVNISGKTLIYQQLRQDETDEGMATEVRICAAQGVCVRRWLLLTTVVSTVLVSWLQLHLRLQPLLLLLIIVLQLCVLLYRCHHRVVSERLLLVAGLGAQVTTQFISGRRHVSFVPWAALVDVIIAETISMQRVLHYTALLVRPHEGRLRLLPLFLTWWPRLACLKQVYQSCQRVLRRRATPAVALHAIRNPDEGVELHHIPSDVGLRDVTDVPGLGSEYCSLLKKTGAVASCSSASGASVGAQNHYSKGFKTSSFSEDFSGTGDLDCDQRDGEPGLKKRKSSYTQAGCAPDIKRRRTIAR